MVRQLPEISRTADKSNVRNEKIVSVNIRILCCCRSNKMTNTFNCFGRSYKKSHRFIGVYDRRTPKLLILDHKLVNDIYVKHFRHFPYNDSSNYVKRPMNW